MEHIAALLLIVGCSGDLEECRELPAPTPIFETMEECRDLLPQARQAVRAGDDKVYAECVFVDPAMEEADAMLEWDVTHEKGLVASVTVGGEVVVASSGDRGGSRVHQQ